MRGFDRMDAARDSVHGGETLALRLMRVPTLDSRPRPEDVGPAVFCWVEMGDTSPEVHVCDGAAWNKIWPSSGGGGAHSHPLSEITGFPIDDTEHGQQDSGNLHPEYHTPAEHAVLGDGSPHHPSVNADPSSGIAVIAGTQEIAHSFLSNPIDFHRGVYQLISAIEAHGGYGAYANEIVVASAGGPTEAHTGGT